MLIGLIRPRETREFEVEGESLEAVSRAAHAQTPAGWDVVSVPVRMSKGETTLKATATIERTDGLEEIEADSFDALRAKTPSGWRLLSVRRV